MKGKALKNTNELGFVQLLNLSRTNASQLPDIVKLQ